MIAIVNVSQHWGIGRRGQLLVRIPEDMAFFRRTTQGNAVVMGRETLRSLPGGKPLKHRDNYVLSREVGLMIPGAQVAGSIDELLRMTADLPQERVFVIGGASVYRQLLPYCTRALVTQTIVPGANDADCFFPNLTETPGWRLTEASDQHQHEGYLFSFCVYDNDSPAALASR